MPDLDYPETCLGRGGTRVVSSAVTDVGCVDMILCKENLPRRRSSLQTIADKMFFGVNFEECPRALVVRNWFLED